MDLFVECPVCEQRFSTPNGSREQSVVCPSCRRTFQLASAAVVPPPAPASGDNLDHASRLEVPSSFGSPSSGPSIISDQPSENQETNVQSVANKPILSLQRKRRQRKRLITTLISSTFLATIIGVLAGLLVRQLKHQPNVSNGSSGTVLAIPDKVVETDPDRQSGTIDNRRPESPKDTVPVEPEKPISSADIPPQDLQYLGRKQTRERWNSVQPHLVSLKVYDGLGSHDAVGTIVDSRGWILTSYNAIKGASKIEVTAGVRSVDDLQGTQPLTDLVRGIVAEQKQDDLVLLSINRRFVVAFSLVQPASVNNVVQSEYLLQCAPLSRDNVYGGTETKIANRAKYNSLDSAGQSIARRKQLVGEDLVWLVATGPTPLPGTPLFKIDGELAGINVFNVDNKNYFLPVDQVKQLIASASGDIRPLSETGDSADGPIAVSTSSDMYEPSIRLNNLAQSCREFDWIPRSRQDYELLQQFANSFSIINKHALDHSESKVVEDQRIDEQRNRLAQQIGVRATSLSAEDESRFTQMNRKFASQELQAANRHLPFYGEVHAVDIVNSFLILRLVGTESYVKAPYVPTDRPPKMQTKWIFFAQTPVSVRPVNYKISETERITAYSVDQLLSFGKQ